jgi:ferredoxin
MIGRRPDGHTESLRVRVHPALCEGWGNCHRWAPEVYPLDDDGMIDVHLLEVPPELAETAWMGAQACPAGVISIVDVKPTFGAPTHSGGHTP